MQNNFIVYVRHCNVMTKEEGPGSLHIVELDQPAPVHAEQLVAKPRSTSIVWKYFGFEVDERGKPQTSNSS